MEGSIGDILGTTAEAPADIKIETAEPVAVEVKEFVAPEPTPIPGNDHAPAKDAIIEKI
jgi:hypothetical protein